MTKPYGCHDRAPFAPHYLPTGAPDTPQYRNTDLGKTDPGCNGCKHKEANHG